MGVKLAFINSFTDIREKMIMEKIVDASGYWKLEENNGVWRLWREQKAWLREPTDAEIGALVDVNYSPEFEPAPGDEEKYKPSGDFIKGF